MKAWLTFWTVSLLVAGASFVFITAVVTLRGAKDMREMFRGLKAKHDHDRNNDKER